jgi:hypothetical protein
MLGAVNWLHRYDADTFNFLLRSHPYSSNPYPNKSYFTFIKVSSIMSKTSADLVKGWQAERTKLQLEITSLKIEERSRSASEREMAAKIAMLDSLINDFSRCDTFSLTFVQDKPRMHPMVRLRRGTHWDTVIAAAV